MGHKYSDFPNDDLNWLLSSVSRTYVEEADIRFDLELIAIDYSGHLEKPMSKKNWLYEVVNGEEKVIARTVAIGVGLYAYCEIGSVWHQQERISTLRTVDKSTRIKIRISDPSKGFLSSVRKTIAYPRSYFHFTDLTVDSPCLVFENENFQIDGGTTYNKIVIPPAEIIRFYYCGSPYFLTQVLNGNVYQGDVFELNSSWIDRDTKEAGLILNENMRNSDVKFVARMLFSAPAHRNTVEISKWVQQEYSNGKDCLLSSRLPLESKTQLSVIGKPVILSKKEDDWGFFVLSIIRCSSDFPFRDLVFGRTNDNSRSDKVNETKFGGIRHTTSSSDDNQDSSISSTDGPDPGLLPASIELEMEDRFTDKPQIRRQKKEVQKVKTVGVQFPWITNKDSFSVSRGETEAGGPSPADLEIIEPEVSIQFQLVFDVVRLLEAEHKCTFLTCVRGEWQEFNGESTGDFPIHTISKIAIKRWLRKKNRGTNDQPNKKTRKLLIVRIISGPTAFYLIDLQPRNTENFCMGLVSRAGFRSLGGSGKESSGILNEILRRLAYNKGIWKGAEIDSLGFEVRSFKHTDAANVFKRIQKYI